jgi:hypothetical protein
MGISAHRAIFDVAEPVDTKGEALPGAKTTRRKTPVITTRH